MCRMDKKTLRKQMIERRNCLDENFVIESGEKIFVKIISSNILNFNKFLLYSSFGNEVPTNRLIQFLLSEGRRVFLPKCDTDKLTFEAVEIIANQTQYQLNKYGIIEPAGNDNSIKSNKIECAIIPGVAFDTRCNRIGFGAGYYDKFLNNNKNIYKIGICYDFQVVDLIDSELYDIGMDMVITEKNTYYKEITSDR